MCDVCASNDDLKKVVSTPPVVHNLTKWRRRHYKITKIKVKNFLLHSVASEKYRTSRKQVSDKK